MHSCGCNVVIFYAQVCAHQATAQGGPVSPTAERPGLLRVIRTPLLREEQIQQMPALFAVRNQPVTTHDAGSQRRVRQFGGAAFAHGPRKIAAHTRQGRRNRSRRLKRRKGAALPDARRICVPGCARQSARPRPSGPYRDHEWKRLLARFAQALLAKAGRPALPRRKKPRLRAKPHAMRSSMKNRPPCFGTPQHVPLLFDPRCVFPEKRLTPCPTRRDAAAGEERATPAGSPD